MTTNPTRPGVAPEPLAPGMPVLTLWQPWASLVAVGVKSIETRSWAAPESLVGGRIAIHAAARKPPKCDPCNGSGCGPGTASGAYVPCDWCGGTGVHGLCAEVTDMPLGAIVATARLMACVPMYADRLPPTVCAHLMVFPEALLLWSADVGELEPVDVSDQLPFGDFRPGRWAWLLDDVQHLAEPVPADLAVAAMTAEVDHAADALQALQTELRTMRSEQRTRAVALLAAATWLPVTDGEPALLATADRLAHWITTGQPAPTQPLEETLRP